MKMINVLVVGLRSECQFRQAFEQGLKGNQHFKPSQWRTDAEVNAGTETNMGIWFASWDEFIGTVKTRWVAVGGAQHQAYFFAFLEFDPGVLKVFQRVTREQ